MVSAPEATLGGFLKRILDERAISGTLLATAAGIAEGSVRNLLKFGLKPDAPAPNPQTLRAVAEYLDINPVYLFQLAGYIRADDLDLPLGPLGLYVGQRVEALAPPQQTMLLDMLATLAQSGETSRQSAAILAHLPASKTLRQRHLTWLQEVDRRIGRLLRLGTESLYVSSIQRRLAALGETVAADQILAIARHPVCMALLSVLLPRKDIPTGLEKLYYLTYFNEDMEIQAEEKRAIMETWHVLNRALTQD
jgi:transcriptional regulator with XRE-family HTH domain